MFNSHLHVYFVVVATQWENLFRTYTFNSCFLTKGHSLNEKEIIDETNVVVNYLKHTTHT
jgi:hypothetical protein